MPEEAALRLLADIGGTNARFALASPGQDPEDFETLAVKDYPTFEEALAAFLGRTQAGDIADAAIAAAGPREGNRIRLTNVAWEIDGERVSHELGGIPVGLFNDLEAVALALPHLENGEIETLADGHAADRPLPKLALNIGTGLGAALALPIGDGWAALPTEAGHMSFAAANDDEVALLKQFESLEDGLSGPGLAWLKSGGDDGASSPWRALFSRILGRAAGDLILATGAWGGLYLCGGVLAAIDENVDKAQFLKAFRGKGRMSPRMERVPVHHILIPEPAFRGLSRVRPKVGRS